MSDFKVGQKVKLTGEGWRDEMHGQVFAIDGHDTNGDAFFVHPETGKWFVYPEGKLTGNRWMVEAVEEPKQRAFLIFTGPYELAWSFKDAEKRVEQLLDEGFDKPTFTNVEVEYRVGETPDITGITARKIADVARAATGGIS